MLARAHASAGRVLPCWPIAASSRPRHRVLVTWALLTYTRPTVTHSRRIGAGKQNRPFRLPTADGLGRLRGSLSAREFFDSDTNTHTARMAQACMPQACCCCCCAIATTRDPLGVWITHDGTIPGPTPRHECTNRIRQPSPQPRPPSPPAPAGETRCAHTVRNSACAAHGDDWRQLCEEGGHAHAPRGARRPPTPPARSLMPRMCPPPHLPPARLGPARPGSLRQPGAPPPPRAWRWRLQRRRGAGGCGGGVGIRHGLHIRHGARVSHGTHESRHPDGCFSKTQRHASSPWLPC